MAKDLVYSEKLRLLGAILIDKIQHSYLASADIMLVRLEKLARLFQTRRKLV
jgi:hypothetical protein